MRLEVMIQNNKSTKLIQGRIQNPILLLPAMREFGFNTSGHCLVSVRVDVALFVRRLMYNHYAIAHAKIPANAHAQDIDQAP